MLQRVLEPEVMDSELEARDYDAMDHSAVNRAFVADFLAVHQGGWKVLDVGTGTALIPIELCRGQPRATVLGVDLSEHMIRRGWDNVLRAGLEQRIRLATVDAKAMPYGSRSFDAVISNSIVHHIPEPRTVLAEMIRVLACSGTLFVRDLLRPADEETLRRIVETYAGAANRHQREMFATSLRAALTLDEVRALVSSVGLSAGDIRQTSDRHWTLSYSRALVDRPGPCGCDEPGRTEPDSRSG